MSSETGDKPFTEVSIDLSSSIDNANEDEGWVLVKKQRITILIPPPSPASPQALSPEIRPKQTGLTRKSRSGWHTSRKKHPKQLVGKKMKAGSLPQNCNEIDCKSKKSLANPSDMTVHKDVLMMQTDMSLHDPVAQVVKSAWAKGAGCAVQSLLHKQSATTRNSFGQFDKVRLPAVASNVVNKVMRARLLERRVAGFGGLRNWLVTHGLGRFVQILEDEKLGIYQLVSLTTSQLKEMGFVAVGPRRKLIHAIDYLCRPNQFEIVS